jgi:hypothetical protein
LIYQSYDSECVHVKNKTGVWSFRQTVCADVNDIIDINALGEIFTQKLPPRHWIEFEFKRERRNSLDQLNDVQKLGWKFSGSGHFDVCYDREILMTDENKGAVMKFWMPVVKAGGKHE